MSTHARRIELARRIYAAALNTPAEEAARQARVAAYLERAG